MTSSSSSSPGHGLLRSRKVVRIGSHERTVLFFNVIDLNRTLRGTKVAQVTKLPSLRTITMVLLLWGLGASK